MILKIVLGVICPLAAAADFVTIENSAGETYVLHVDENDTFLDVMREAASCGSTIINAGTLQGTTGSLMGDAHGVENKIDLTSGNILITYESLPRISVLDFYSKRLKAVSRNYSAGYTAAETADIAYIIRTLANSSLAKIKGAESSLKKAGDRIDHVHPLQFLVCVFTNEELKTCMRNLQGRSWVWKDFLKGLTESLSNENAKDNVIPFAEDFAAKVNVDLNQILPILQTGRWERFVNTLIDVIPRESGGNRYNI